jgi:tetratricopeptide (TPR) repeat protein
MWLQPSYLFAGIRYFQLQRAAGEFKDAERTLEIIRPFATEAQIQALRAELAASREDMGAAIARVTTLCLDPSSPRWAIEQAADAIIRRKANLELEIALKNVTTEPVFHPAAPSLWARSRIAAPAFANATELDWLVSLGAPGDEAILTLLDGIGRAASAAKGSKKLTLRWHLSAIRRRCDARLRGDLMYWGKIGYVLVSMQRYDEAIAWLEDWRKREEPQSWMVHNLVVAYLCQGEIDAAREVLRHVAVEIMPREQVSAYLKLLCALGACLDGDPYRAGRRAGRGRVEAAARGGEEGRGAHAHQAAAESGGRGAGRGGEHRPRAIAGDRI